MICPFCEGEFSALVPVADDGESWCESCIVEHCKECVGCGGMFQYTTQVGDKYYCDVCRDEHLAECKICLEWGKVDYMDICEGCREKIKPERDSY